MTADDSPREGVSPNRIRTATGRIETWVGEVDCPGASVAIVCGREILAAEGFGHRRSDPPEPATENTVYAVGSVAKPVTALATLLLDERGRIDLRDPVSEYVPCFEDAPGDPITIRQLLSHTSGMPRDDLPFVAPELEGWDDLREFLDGTLDRRWTDGDRFVYYNSGYAVLARLVEVVTDEEFHSFVEREIFDPLGMGRSTFDTSLVDEEFEDVMTPYVPGDDGLSAVEIPDSPVLTGPSGLLTTAPDLARFLQAHVADRPPFDDVALERMRSPTGTRERFVDGTALSYGLGWEIRPFGDDRVIGHGGNTGVSAGYVGFLENSGTGVAICCNATADPSSIGHDVLAILTGRDQRSLDPARRIERAVTALTGRYESHSGTHRATVRREDACLEITFGGGDVDSFGVRVLPTDLESSTYRFTDVEHLASTTDVEFFTGGDEAELLFEGMLFRRVEDEPGESGGADAETA